MKTYHGQIVSRFKDDLEQQGLDFRRIVDGNVGKPFKTKSGSEVYRLKAPSGRTFYLKRYLNQSLKKCVKSLSQGQRPFTTASAEFSMANLLREAGSDAMEPFAWAEVRYAGVIPIRSAVLVKEVKGVPFDQVFTDSNFSGVLASLLFQLGSLYANLHLAGHLRTPRLSDLICRDLKLASNGELKVAIIDLDLKGDSAYFKPFNEKFCSTAIGDALYNFIRARYIIESKKEIRSFLRGYRSSLYNKGYAKNILKIKDIIKRTDERLAAHNDSAELSSKIPGMPQSLREILK